MTSSSSSTKLTAREYAETTVLPGGPENNEWLSGRDDFLLYIHTGGRFHVSYERHAVPGFGLARADALAEQGVYDADVDTAEFAEEFIRYFCDHLSLHDLRILVPRLVKHLESEEERHARLITKEA